VTTQSALPESPGLAGCVAALAAVCALAWASLATTVLPEPAGAGAPADAFSSERAARHLHALTRTPRPIATTMNEDARRYIIDTARTMGYQPEVQEATVQRQWIDRMHNIHVTLAVVRNVVVRKPGIALDHATRPALLLASHYDSNGDTVGASDASSSAAMLETLRALKNGPALANDVVFLFADGDAVGEMGELGFIEPHPLAKRVGLTLRFRDLGNEGPVIPQDAHGDAGVAIAAWAEGSAEPRGSSLMRELSSLMPNARGTGPLATLQAPLLQFAAVQGKLGKWDTPERFAPATLQHEGDTMLSLTRELGAKPLTRAAAKPDQLFFSLPLAGIVHYPATSLWASTRIVCLLLACVCCVAIARSGIDGVDIVKGAFGYALIAGVPLALLYLDGLHGAFSYLSALQSGALYVEGIALLMAGLFVLGLRRLCASVGAMAASLGALVWLAAVLVAISWLAPGASYLLALPVPCAAIAIGVLHLPRVQSLPSWTRFALLTAGLLPAVALAVPAARDAFVMPTPFRMHFPVWLLALVLGVSVPLLVVAGRRYTVRFAVLGAAALLAVPGSASAPERAPTPPLPLVYYKDMVTWSEWWLARQPALDDWSRALFPGLQKPRRLVELFGWDSDDIWYVRAKRTGLQFPYAILLRNDDEPKRRVAFDLSSKNAAPHIELRLDGGKPVRATMNGRLLSQDAQTRNWSMSIYGMRDQKMHFDLVLLAGILQIHVDEHMPGVPEHALPAPMPAHAFIPMTGETISHDALWFY
jgi:hypothetical protein